MSEKIIEEVDKMFENDRGILSRLRILFSGLRMPHDTKEYKEARIELQRLYAPVMAITIPILLILMLIAFATRKETSQVEFITDIIEYEDVKEDLKDVEVEPPEITEMPDLDFSDFSITPDIAMDTPAPAIADGPVSPQPQSVDAVVQIKSPVILRGIFGDTRNAGMRGAQLAKFGGNKNTEMSVIRSLRWLKAVQNPDGSWPNNKVAMTGLAILTFLAHGEKPGDSPEFGDTVQRALEFLISKQNKTGGGLFTRSGNGYAHAIATYAMCEAYGMTMNPNVKEAADKGLEVIIKGQHPSGGWDYNWKQSERDDTSVMGWAAQALKAGMMADFYHDPDELLKASKMCIKGFKKNGFQDGGFGYTSPGKGGLSGVGTLCMQFHHAANDPYVKNTLQNIIYGWKPEWTGFTPQKAAAGEKIEKSKELPPGMVGGACPQYYLYYAGQSTFQSGGNEWTKWNERMWPSYVAAQFKIEKGEAGSKCTCGQGLCNKLKEPYVDAKGEYQEIGHWVNADAHTDRPIMDTCLAALQMMVYYRYLPTFQKIEVPKDVVASTDSDKGDIEVFSDL